MRCSEIDAIREEAILASLAGFPFLLVMGFAWITAGVASYWVPADLAPWMYPLLGMPGIALAIALERRIGYVRADKSNFLLPLALQVLAVQLVAFPAVALVADMAPHYLPVAFAAVVGAHFLPFHWIYRTPIYTVLGIVVAVGPYVLAAVYREKALHYTGFFVGTSLLIGALLVRSHARATWERSGRAHVPKSVVEPLREGR
jgi:hypothetical protein